MPTRAMTGLWGRWRNASGRSWPICKSRSMRRRVETWTSAEARASASSGSTSAASRSGRAVDQSGATRLGELLCGGALQQVLQPHQRLGGKEGSAPYAARAETKELRLDTME